MRIILLMVFFYAAQATAEVKELVTGFQYGLTYLPLMVMKDQRLVEKYAPGVAVEWRVLNGPAPINDGLLSGALHFGAVGTSSLVTLWDKTKSSLGIRLAAALSSMPMWLTSNKARIRNLGDFTTLDKIALPSVKVGVQAVTLQKASAEAFGKDKFNRLDSMTVGMSHPDATVAMASEKSGVAAHFGAPPFQQQEIALGADRVRIILRSTDVWGGKAMFVGVVSSTRFREKNPSLYQAYISALSEAMSWINTHHEEAAQTYLRFVGSKDIKPSIKTLLDDPENDFDLTPHGVLKYATFMHETGAVKNLAADWKDLCHPNLSSTPGS